MSKKITKIIEDYTKLQMHIRRNYNCIYYFQCIDAEKNFNSIIYLYIKQVIYFLICKYFVCKFIMLLAFFSFKHNI